MTNFYLKDIDLAAQLKDRREYEDKLDSLQSRIRDLQSACYHNGHRIVIVFEGWDASGKGGAIRRLTEKLDPRSCRVYPTTKPDERERQQHYLQRFWDKIPAKGQIVIFDRSWYGRILVERIEGFASVEKWTRAYTEINQFETTLSDDGILVIKLFLHISQEEQLNRYLERLENPKKHWKLTEDDLRNRSRADAYETAYEDMLNKTHQHQAPWFTIAGEHKWFARVSVLETVCKQIEGAIDTRIPHYSKDEIAQTKASLGL